MLRSLLFVWIGSLALGVSALAHDGQANLAGDLVAAHNQVRAGLGLPPVTWDADLALHAQGWADQLIAEEGLRHSPHAIRAGEGENLARIDGGRTSATDLFSGWAGEVALYRYGPIDCGDLSALGATGHYTQIVSRRTRRIGCAMSSTPESQVLVCRYAPPGNVCGVAPY